MLFLTYIHQSILKKIYHDFHKNIKQHILLFSTFITIRNIFKH